MTHWVFWERQYKTFPGHSQSNCITGQQNPQGCWTPGCSHTGTPQKKSTPMKSWGRITRRGSSLRTQQAWGGRPQSLICHQSGRRQGEEARELLALCTDKVGGGYARVGETWGLEGRGDSLHFVIYCHAISLISPAKSTGLAGVSSGGKAAAPQLRSLSSLFSGTNAPKGQRFYPPHKWHFSTLHGPNQILVANSYLQLYQLQ